MDRIEPRLTALSDIPTYLIKEMTSFVDSSSAWYGIKAQYGTSLARLQWNAASAIHSTDTRPLHRHNPLRETVACRSLASGSQIIISRLTLFIISRGEWREMTEASPGRGGTAASPAQELGAES